MVASKTNGESEWLGLYQFQSVAVETIVWSTMQGLIWTNSLLIGF